MIIRVISGVFAFIIALLVIFAGIEIFDAACFLIAALAVYEIFEAFRAKGYRPVYFAGYAACICMFIGSIEYWDRHVWQWVLNIVQFIDIRAILYLSLLLMFCFLITGIGKYTVADRP